MKSLIVPAWEWYGWQPETLTFPDNWEVHEQKMKGHSAPALNAKEIEEKMQHPFGTTHLNKLARGKRKCVVIFDDMTRPTKTTQMLPTILQELHRGGLSGRRPDRCPTDAPVARCRDDCDRRHSHATGGRWWALVVATASLRWRERRSRQGPLPACQGVPRASQGQSEGGPSFRQAQRRPFWAD